MRRALSALAVVAVALLVTLGWSASPAAAHAGLVSSDPAAGSTVTTAPDAVTLTFDEDMAEPAAVVVTDAGGRRVENGDATVRGPRVAVAVDLPAPGRYTVAYRAVSADGHPVSDQLTFDFVPPGATAPAAAVPTTGTSHDTLRTVAVIGIGLLLTVILGISLVRALRTNQEAARR